MSIKETIDSINKAYGKVVVYSAAEVPPILKVPLKESPAFDYVTGGGIPINRITEIWGAYSSTKSLHSLYAIAAFQKVDWNTRTPYAIKSVTYKKETTKLKSGDVVTLYVPKTIKPTRGYKPKEEIRIKQCAVIDLEGTFDPLWAAKQGVDLKGLLHICPDSASEAVDVIDVLLRDENLSLIVIDSLGAVGSDAEVEASMENEQMAVNARFWNKAVRKFQCAINANPGSDITMLSLNSAYSKVGFVMGNPEELKNGSGWKFAKSISVRVGALKEIPGKIGGVDGTIGRNITFKAVKNKTSTPHLRAESFFQTVDDDEGGVGGKFDIITTLITLGLKFGLIARTGAWYTYKESKVHGMGGLVALIKENNFQETLTEEIYSNYG
jgi:RecA/RadA recombinase